MLLERIYDHDLAQASYLIGCQAAGQAIVVDPRRDIEEYLDLAARHGMAVTAVTETHIHADYLSGSRELAAATGATLYVSAEGGTDWQYRFEAERLTDGDSITLGNLTMTALHTPGHTPEHLSYLVTDGAVTDQPGYLLSGDFVFSGDLGRPDLLDEAAGGVDTRYEGARQEPLAPGAGARRRPLTRRVRRRLNLFRAPARGLRSVHDHRPRGRARLRPPTLRRFGAAP